MIRSTRTLAAVLVAWALTFALAGCGPDGAAQVDPAAERDSTGEYTVRFEAVDFTGSYALLSNGLPVERRPFNILARPGQVFAAYMTPALVSSRNTAAVEVVPFLRRTGGAVAAMPVRLRLWVEAPDGAVVPGTEVASDSAVAAWTRELHARWPGWRAAEDSVFAADPGLAAALADSVEAGARSARYGTGPALDAARAWAEAHPVRVETSFTRPSARPPDEQPSFDAVVREAAVIRGTPADSARLRAYGAWLYERTVARDTAALWQAFEPKYADEFLWWGGEAGVGADSTEFMAGTRERVVMEEVAPFTASDVRLRSWAGGRVWELYRPGADGLLQPPGGGAYRAVHVGVGPDGELRVVR